MAGRKLKPTAGKKLEGNPGKRKLNSKEPVPEKGMLDCPNWLLPEAKIGLERLCEKLSIPDGSTHGNHTLRDAHKTLKNVIWCCKTRDFKQNSSKHLAE